MILHSMFLHAAREGWKEAERFICQGHWHGLPRPDLEANLPAIQLVGYQTSQKEIWDLYHEVYLLRRSPGPPPCGLQLREEAIEDILTSLRSHLQRQGALLCWRRTYTVLLWLPLAHLPPRILIQGLQKRKPT